MKTSNETLKMGDKVMIVGLIGKEGPGEIVATPPQLLDGWYWVKTSDGQQLVVHIRNLDRVYENERKPGSTGRMMKVGDEVLKQTSVKARIVAINNDGRIITSHAGAKMDVWYTHVERRIKDEGRKARR